MICCTSTSRRSSNLYGVRRTHWMSTPLSFSQRTVVVISLENSTETRTIRTSCANSSGFGSSHSRNSRIVSRGSDSSLRAARNWPWIWTTCSNVMTEAMAAYRRACSSMWPPSSVRFNSTTTRFASLSSPRMSMRRLLSAQLPNSSANTITFGATESIFSSSSRWRSPRSLTPSSMSDALRISVIASAPISRIVMALLFVYSVRSG